MGSTKIVQPSPPPAPTATQAAEDFSRSLPIYYQTALQYEPKIAQMEYDIQSQLYPQETALRQQIGQDTLAGLRQSVPEWYNQGIRDTLKAQFGRNLVYNPQAQEQYGLATNQAARDWKNYYTNIGLSMAGRIPVTTPNNIMSSYTPQANMNFAQQGYGTGAGIYGTQMQNYTSQSQYNPWMNLAGSIGGSIAGAGTYGLGQRFNWWGK
jgi:hypothetical protein